MLDVEDWALFEKLMHVGRHGTIAAVLRTALVNYTVHLGRQGLIDVPPEAFEFTKKGKRDAVR